MDSVTVQLPHIEIGGLPIPRDIAYTPEPEKFWIQEDGTWWPYSEKNVRLRLKGAGWNDRGQNGAISQVDQAILQIQLQRKIDIAIALAGWPAGLLEIQGKRILVTEGAEALKAEDVPFDNLLNYLVGLFGEEPLPYFIGWVQWARRNIGRRTIFPGQVPIFVGPSGAGKSLLQKYITILLGGRDASAFEYMRGSTFNEDMFEAAHLILEDRFFEGGKAKSREFGAALKEIAVNHVHRCHGKFKKAVTLWPKWRMTISMNDEAENLTMLPPLDASIKDKIMLFQVSQPDYPVDLGTDKGWDEWDKIAKAELPGLAKYIDEYELGDLVAPRYGVKAWHDEHIINAEAESTPQAIFLQCLMHDLPFALEDTNVWTGTATDLKRLLEGDSMPSARQTRQILNWSNACGSYLGRLKSRYPEAIQFRYNMGKRIWTINLEGLQDDMPLAA
jgi:hypothetical protein